jgi:hypothetical protein
MNVKDRRLKPITTRAYDGDFEETCNPTTFYLVAKIELGMSATDASIFTLASTLLEDSFSLLT